MTKPPYVPAVGSRDANIVFVGEAPGKNEEKQRKPFVGYSGKLFRNTLARMGILDTDVFITNLCHYRPPGNHISRWLKKRGRSYVPNELVAEGIVELYQDLAEIKPNVVVPLGNSALWALCGVRKINRRRGSIMPIEWDLARARALSEKGLLDNAFLDSVAAVQGTKVIPTYHPAYILRQMGELAVFQTDIERIKKDSAFPELRLPEREYWIDPPEPKLNELVAKLLTADKISYDIECVGYRLYCIGFACDPSWALVLTAGPESHQRAFRDILSSDVPKIAQNGLFDLTFLAMYSSLDVKAFAADTMVAQHACFPELRKGLDFLCSIYTREPYYKDEGKNWNPKDAEDVERFLTYNGKDVCATLEVWEAQERDDLTDPGYRITFDRVMEQLPVYAEQTIRGIKIDLQKMYQFRAKYVEDWRVLQEGLDRETLAILAKIFQRAKEAGRDKRAKQLESFIRARAADLGSKKGAINVNSPKVLKELCYKMLQLKPKKSRSTGKLTTNEDALKELFNESGNAILLTIVKIRQIRKRISSYLSVETDGNGVTHFSVNPVKTKTGRSSYGKTITGQGLNMQTVPHELRSIYIPDEPGYKFAYIDLDQAEARIVAYKGGITRMIECFEHPNPEKYTESDVHSLTAHNNLGIPYEEIKEYPHRYLGKRCNHAFNYEMGPVKFYTVLARDAHKTGIRISRKEAKQLRNRHLQTYPELTNYWEEIRGRLRHDRTIINPMGRKRVFLGRLDAATFREAFSHYAQSTVADVLRTGMVAVHNDVVSEFRSLGYSHTRIVLEVHDALLLQYHEDTEEEFLAQAEAAMAIPFEIEGREIVIPRSIEAGWNFGERDKDDNPNGLVKYELKRAG